MIRNTGFVYDIVPSAALVVAVGILTTLAWQVSTAFRDSHRVHVIQESVVAAIVAEDAAFEAVERAQKLPNGGVALRPFVVEDSVGLHARVEPAQEGARRSLQIFIKGKKRRSYAYHCDLLPGAAPTCLGDPLSVRHTVVAARPQLRRWLRQNQTVRLEAMDDGVVANLLRPEYGKESGPAPGRDFVEDDAIALLRIPSGTDRPDFRIAAAKTHTWRPMVPEDGVQLLHGNLWIDRCDRELTVQLSKPFTLVVTGNVYLGRSIVVRGGGRLVIVARRGKEPTFVDRDGDGGFGSGDRPIGYVSSKRNASYRGAVEGAGAVYLGLPGSVSEGSEIQIEASLICGAEAYVRATKTIVRGALVVEEGITWAAGATLALPGDALPNIEREQIPGFRRAGVTRPGMLTRTR